MFGEKIVDHPQGVQWVSQFKGNMSSNVGDARQEALAGGGTAIEVLPKQDRVAHWGSDQAVIFRILKTFGLF